MKRILQTLVLGLVLLLLYMGYKTLTFTSQQIQVETVDLMPVGDQVINRFAQALTIKTISPEKESDFDSLAFFQFNDYLKTSFPMADSLLEKKSFNHFSLLYQWKGSDPSLNPVILMAHLDVVPVIEENYPTGNNPLKEKSSTTPFGAVAPSTIKLGLLGYKAQKLTSMASTKDKLYISLVTTKKLAD